MGKGYHEQSQGGGRGRNVPGERAAKDSDQHVVLVTLETTAGNPGSPRFRIQDCWTPGAAGSLKAPPVGVGPGATLQ